MVSYTITICISESSAILGMVITGRKVEFDKVWVLVGWVIDRIYRGDPKLPHRFSTNSTGGLGVKRRYSNCNGPWLCCCVDSHWYNTLLSSCIALAHSLQVCLVILCVCHATTHYSDNYRLTWQWAASLINCASTHYALQCEYKSSPLKLFAIFSLLVNMWKILLVHHVGC